MKQLPDKLSDLMRLALDDLTKVEADPRYKVDMRQWFKWKDYVCHVCFAGAVMAQTMEEPITGISAPQYYPYDISRKLRALDLIRVGNVFSACREMDIPVAQRTVEDRDVTGYAIDPIQWRRDMNQILTELEAAGL